MKPKLVSNWKNAYRWISIHCMVFTAALQGTWLTLSEDMRRALPPE